MRNPFHSKFLLTLGGVVGAQHCCVSCSSPLLLLRHESQVHSPECWLSFPEGAEQSRFWHNVRFCTYMHGVLGSSRLSCFTLCSLTALPVCAIRQVRAYLFFIALSGLTANFMIFNENDFLTTICQFSRIVPLSPLCRWCYRGTEMEAMSDCSHSSKTEAVSM